MPSEAFCGYVPDAKMFELDFKAHLRAKPTMEPPKVCHLIVMRVISFASAAGAA